MKGTVAGRAVVALALVSVGLGGCAKASTATGPRAAPAADADDEAGQPSGAPPSSQQPSWTHEEPSGAPSSSQPPSWTHEEHKTTAPSTGPSRYATPPPGEDAEATLGGGAEGEFSRWLSEFAADEATVMASGVACFQACRALGSMARATGRLCELAESDAERARCEDARARLVVAKGVVRSRCRTCDGAPPLEGG